MILTFAILRPSILQDFASERFFLSVDDRFQFCSCFHYTLTYVLVNAFAWMYIVSSFVAKSAAVFWAKTGDQNYNEKGFKFNFGLRFVPKQYIFT